MMPAYHKNLPDDIIPARLPEAGIPVAFKYALLENVVVWALDCGHKIVAKPDWVDYAADGIGPDQLICPYCKKVDPNYIYVTNAGMGLIKARGIEAAEVRAYVGSFDTWVFPIIRNVPEFDLAEMFNFRTIGPADRVD